MYQRLDQAGGFVGWFKVRFRIHQCRAAILYTLRGTARVSELYVSRAEHSARFVVLPDSTRGTIISNKSPTVDVLSAFLARERKRDVSRPIVSLPFDEKNDVHSLTRFVREHKNSICEDLLESTMHVLPAVTYLIECYDIILLFVMYNWT